MAKMFVQCPECKEKHPCDAKKRREITPMNIEETIEGWDLLTYVCLATGKETKAVVRSKK